MKTRLVVFFLLVLVVACQKDISLDPESWLEAGEEYAGGATTVVDESVNAFGQAAPNLTGDKNTRFVVGNSFFKRNWVTAPSSTTGLDGLGPLFNTRSCSSCHALDGRGSPPLSPDEAPLGLLFRLSTRESVWEPLPDPNYGTQFHPRAILGVVPDGSVSVSYQEMPGHYPDGTSYSLRIPVNTFALNHGPFSPGIMISPRVAPHMIGMGLLEAIDEAQLLALADPNDANGDGISGRPNYVWDVTRQQKVIGRFGWKANEPTVRQQVAGAFNGDIGLTTSIFPHQPCPPNRTDCREAPGGGDPEVSDPTFNDVVLYSAALAVPRRRSWKNETVLNGKEAFFRIGCNSCHHQKIKTGSGGEHPEFRNQTIYPYTDLLLHDMGEGLADNRPDHDANGREWRTPPLWGIGLIPLVNGHSFLLHDGRARNIEEAILWHGGEAEAVKQSFKKLQKREREALIKFVESL